jgi:hypothetical protein
LRDDAKYLEDCGTEDSLMKGVGDRVVLVGVNSAVFFPLAP